MRSQWIHAPTQIRNIAIAVSAAFAASNLTPEEINPGRIEIIDLPWSAPPLVSNLAFGDAMLADYLDIPLKFDQRTLAGFWHETLQTMWNRPGAMWRRGCLATCGRHLSGVPIGLRALRFSRPMGVHDSLAGAMFSLELAHAVRISVPLHSVTLNKDNYIVVAADGEEFGIRKGLPLISSPWTENVSGQVLDLVEMTRGEVTYTCMYDQIASIRSVLHVHRKSFPRNFEALDLALQALRILSMGAHCPPLVKEMAIAPIDMRVVREKERLLADALDVMRADMPDRSKLETIHQILVPTVLSGTSFRRQLFASPRFPFALAKANVDKIFSGLESMYLDLPPDIQRSGVCRTN